jgi:hypothetical protein
VPGIVRLVSFREVNPSGDDPMAKIGTKAWIAALADLMRLIPEDKQEHGAYALETLIGGEQVPPSRSRDELKRDCEDAFRELHRLREDRARTETDLGQEIASLKRTVEELRRQLRTVNAEEFDRLKKLEVTQANALKALEWEAEQRFKNQAQERGELDDLRAAEGRRQVSLREAHEKVTKSERALALANEKVAAITEQYTEIKKKFDLSREEVLKLQAELRAAKILESSPSEVAAKRQSDDVVLAQAHQAAVASAAKAAERPFAKPGSLIGALNFAGNAPRDGIAHSPAEVHDVAPLTWKDLMGASAKNRTETELHLRAFGRMREWIKATSGFVVVVSSEENRTFAFANEADGGESGPANKATVYTDLDAAKKRRDTFREHYAKGNGWCDYRAEVIDLEHVVIVP